MRADPRSRAQRRRDTGHRLPTTSMSGWPVPRSDSRRLRSGRRVSVSDDGQLAPMVAATNQSLAAAGIAEPLQVVLADAGYWSSPQIAELKESNIADSTRNPTPQLYATASDACDSFRCSVPEATTGIEPVYTALQAAA
jgi:hypothetical protein